MGNPVTIIFRLWNKCKEDKMINSQEIIERSLYKSVLTTVLNIGYTLDPEDYYPITAESQKRFEEDKKKIIDSKGMFIYIFGTGNNQSKGMKDNLPRICIDSQGFLPGDIGLPKQNISREEDDYVVTDQPYETIDQFIDIHLVSNNQSDIRFLLNILSSSIPQRGYIKPYIYDKAPFDGNIFIESVNFFNIPNLDKGLIEKVYQFEVKDSLLDYSTGSTEEPIIIPPIRDISLLVQNKIEIKS